jgi:hypothetical protein
MGLRRKGRQGRMTTNKRTEKDERAKSERREMAELENMNERKGSILPLSEA